MNEYNFLPVQYRSQLYPGKELQGQEPQSEDTFLQWPGPLLSPKSKRTTVRRTKQTLNSAAPNASES